MESNRLLSYIGIFVLILIFIYSFVIHFQSSSNYMPIMPYLTSEYYQNTYTPLKYLEIYDTQDEYQQNPWIYPVPQTTTTAMYEVYRNTNI